MSDKFFHSVKLDEDKCKGCTNCIKGCPTEAIRVHKSKAQIINERCIDCGICLKSCPNHAKKAITDPLNIIKDYKYRVALPAPTLYGQYRQSRSRNHLLTALKRLGFDDVFEVAVGAEAISNASIDYLKSEIVQKPVISSACPVISRLIEVRFPNLRDNILKLESPAELSAKIARAQAAAKTNLNPRDIGIFFITPCAAKMSIKNRPMRGDQRIVDGVISIQDIYIPLREQLKAVTEEEEEDLAVATAYGVRWPNPGGESLALGINKFLAVDGIHEVIKIFEEVENGHTLDDVDFIEALACTGGCLGGPLTAKNVYVSQVIMKSIRDEAKGKFQVKELPKMEIDYRDYLWDKELDHTPIMQLDPNIMQAMKKMEEMEKLIEELPGLDCGACGAPNCRALAEDIVKNEAKITDCIFKLREKVRKLAGEMLELESLMPPVMDTSQEDEPEDSSLNEDTPQKEGGDIENKRFGKRYGYENIKWRTRT